MRLYKVLIQNNDPTNDHKKKYLKDVTNISEHHTKYIVQTTVILRTYTLYSVCNRNCDFNIFTMSFVINVSK